VVSNYGFSETFFFVVCDDIWIAIYPSFVVVHYLSGNKYVLVAIDHYFKWCATKHVQEHTVAPVMRFFEKEIICRFGISKYIFIDKWGRMDG